MKQVFDNHEISCTWRFFIWR